jgi:hypothetical protein
MKRFVWTADDIIPLDGIEKATSIDVASGNPWREDGTMRFASPDGLGGEPNPQRSRAVLQSVRDHVDEEAGRRTHPHTAWYDGVKEHVVNMMQTREATYGTKPLTLTDEMLTSAVQRIESELRAVMAEFEFVRCTQPWRLEQVLSGTSWFMTQYETGGSSGSYSPERRLRLEHQMFGHPMPYADDATTEQRRAALDAVVDRNGGADFTTQPKYGMVIPRDLELRERDNGRTLEQMLSEEEAPPDDDEVLHANMYRHAEQSVRYTADQYGSAVVRFKPHVRTRTTFTMGDSLAIWSDPYKAELPSRLDTPRASSLPAAYAADLALSILRGKDAETVRWETKRAVARVYDTRYYVEGQAHGGALRAADIRHVTFMHAGPSPELAERMRALGITFNIYRKTRESA